MMRCVRYHDFGSPEVLRYEEAPTPKPGAGEVLVQVLAVAIDFIQLHLRRGGSGRIGSRAESQYGTNPPPHMPGGGACVEVAALGPGVADVQVGTRHLVGGLRPGSYAEFALADAAALKPRPDGRPSPTAFPAAYSPAQAAAFDYAPVAHHTLRTAAGLRKGETVLIHAAAGGTGVFAVQLAKHWGARVLATAGSAEKLQLARTLGADAAIDYRSGDFVPAVLDATNGRGVDVVWDPVGGETFARSPECMAEGGRLVSLGSNSFTGTGQLDFLPFWQKNLRLIGWGGVSNAQSRAPHAMEELLDLAAAGSLRPVVGQVFPLAQAASAHRLIEERRSVGKVVLVP